MRSPSCTSLVWPALLAACGAGTKPVEDGGSPAIDAGADAGLDAGPDATECHRECPFVDRDGDGEAPPPCGTDCDDADPSVRTGRPDPAGDGGDTDCDGVDGVDRDGDGHLAVGAGGDDCDDTAAFVHPGAPDGQGWLVQAFDAGPRTQLALDPWGKPVVAYTSWSPDLLCLDLDYEPVDGVSTVEVARQVAGVWSSERVDLTCSQGDLGLEVAGSGRMAVAYTGALPITGKRYTVHVATRDPSGWLVDDVDTSWADVAITADACGDPIVGYTWIDGERHDPDEGRVARAAERWAVEVIQDGSRLDGIDLAVSPRGALAASYWQRIVRVNAVVTYAAEGPTGWRVEDVDAEDCTNCLWDTSLAFGPGGEPEIAVLGYDGAWLLRRSEGRWQRHELAPGIILSEGTNYEKPQTISLAIDDAGTSHVAFVTDHEVVYATDRGGSWTTEQVGPGILEACGWVSLALDRAGGVHLAWYATYEENGSDLPPRTGRYAEVARPGDGVDQNCDGVDGVDADGDGHASVDTGGDDPDDAAR